MPSTNPRLGLQPDQIAPTAERGALLIVNDIADDTEDEFNLWYQQQRLIDRLSTAGFQSARRYRAIDGQPAYLALYECESIDVLTSDAYRQKLANPSEWAKRILPKFRNVLRSACRKTLSIGNGIGGTAVLVQCKPIKGRADEARRFIEKDLTPRLDQSGALIRISLLETDTAVTGVPSSERALRNDQENYPEWVLFIETYDLEKAALTVHSEVLTREPAKTGLLFGSWARYQLICAYDAKQ